jgi:hypothetical protein
MSFVSKRSFRTTGTPWSFERGPLALRSASRARAISRALGLSVMTELIFGPAWSYASIRLRYMPTSFSDVSEPASIAAWMSPTLAVSRLNSAACASGTAARRASARGRIRVRDVMGLSDCAMAWMEEPDVWLNVRCRCGSQMAERRSCEARGVWDSPVRKRARCQQAR